jgi:hypothetical protein
MLVQLFAQNKLDGIGGDNRRIAKLCSVITTVVMNAVRLSGHHVDDHLYRDEEWFMPYTPTQRAVARQQSWGEMKSNLGY